MSKKLKPVSIWGIEFDALIDESKTFTATIPTYPVENGFSVSDSIINEPLTLSLTLFLTNTPVTWLMKHGTDSDRVDKICEEIEQKWESKELTKIVTPTAIYKDMGITSITISKSESAGYSKEIAITAQKVYKTKRKTDLVPQYSSKSGTSGVSAGTASTTEPKSEEEEATNKKSILFGVADGLFGDEGLISGIF